MERIVNRAGWVLALALGLFVVGALAGVVSGGPLDPPAPPASTDGVRLPGTPISTAPFTISSPGNYYLTRDIVTTAPGSAITVMSDYVTIDLMGFTMQPGFGAATAIDASSSSRLTVRNGRLAFFTNSIDNTNGSDGRFEGLSIQPTTGLAIKTGDRAAVSNVDIYSGASPVSLGKSARVDGLSVNSPSSGTSLSAGDGAQMTNVNVVGGFPGILVTDDALLSKVQVIGASGWGLIGGNRVTVLDCTVTTVGTLTNYGGIRLTHYGVVRGCSVQGGTNIANGIEVGNFGLVENNAIRNVGWCAIEFDGEHARANNNQIAQAPNAVCAQIASTANAVYNNSYTGIGSLFYVGPSGSLNAAPMASADTATNPLTNITQ